MCSQGTRLSLTGNPPAPRTFVKADLNSYLSRVCGKLSTPGTVEHPIFPGSPRTPTQLDAIIQMEVTGQRIRSTGEDVGTFAAQNYRRRHSYLVL